MTGSEYRLMQWIYVIGVTLTPLEFAAFSRMAMAIATSGSPLLVRDDPARVDAGELVAICHEDLQRLRWITGVGTYRLRRKILPRVLPFFRLRGEHLCLTADAEALL
jgi:hypothetical protein